VRIRIFADALVTGTLTDLQSYVAINCRLIRTATGEVFAGARTRIVVDQGIRSLLEKPLRERASEGISPVHDGEGDANHDAPIYSLNGIQFEGYSCSRNRSNQLTCTIRVENTAKDDQELYIIDAMLVDEFGNQYRGHNLSFGESTYTGSGNYHGFKTLPFGVRVGASIIARDTKDNIKSITIISHWEINKNVVQITLRNVPAILED